MLNSPYELLIFDWDGTLIDSEASIVQSMQASIADLSLEARSDTQIRHIIGLGLREALVTLYPDQSDVTYNALTDRYRFHFLNDDPAEPFPGVEELLLRLEAAGYLLAVATGKGRSGLDRAFAQVGFGHVFSASRCADETRSKPHPLMLEELLDFFGMSAENAIMVGDTSYDLDMARNAGMDSAAVCTGVHDKSVLLQSDPVVCLEAAPQLWDWLHTQTQTKQVLS